LHHFSISVFISFKPSQTQSAELYSSEGASFAAAQQATQLKGGSSANSFGFPSSEPVLSLLSRPPYGALPLLEALSADERSDGDDKYAQVLASYHEGHPKFAECGRDSPWRAGGAPTHERHFGVHHYAGTVKKEGRKEERPRQNRREKKRR